MNILTFDIEDWFHTTFEKSHNNEALWDNFESRIERNTHKILELLEEKNIKASFFILGWIARKYPKLVKIISESGHDIGSHSDVHNLVSSQSKQEFSIDLQYSIKSIEDVIGKKIITFRAPAFSIGRRNIWAFEVLSEMGIEIDCSVFPNNHDFGGFPEISVDKPFKLMYENTIIKEFPMSTYKVIGKRIVLTGGGYFRFFPYGLIERHMKKACYNMTYFHPRDFDHEQPILKDLSRIRRFKSYYGLKTSLSKFEKLLSIFKFTSVSEAVNSINWDKAKTIDINAFHKAEI